MGLPVDGDKAEDLPGYVGTGLVAGEGGPVLLSHLLWIEREPVLTRFVAQRGGGVADYIEDGFLIAHDWRSGVAPFCSGALGARSI